MILAPDLYPDPLLWDLQAQLRSGTLRMRGESDGRRRARFVQGLLGQRQVQEHRMQVQMHCMQVPTMPAPSIASYLALHPLARAQEAKAQAQSAHSLGNWQWLAWTGSVRTRAVGAPAVAAAVPAPRHLPGQA